MIEQLDAEARAYLAGLFNRLSDGEMVCLGEFTGGERVVPTSTDIVAEYLRDLADKLEAQ